MEAEPGHSGARENRTTNKYEEPIRHQEHFLFTQDFLAEDQSVR